MPSKKIQIVLAVLIITTVVIFFFNYSKKTNFTYSSVKSNLAIVESSSKPTNSAQKTNIDQYGPKASSAITDTEKVTYTDILVQDFYSQLQRANQSNLIITTNNADQFVNNYLKSAPLPTINHNTYSTSSLIIVSPTNSNLRDYQTAVASIFSKNWPIGEDQNELIIIADAFSNGDPKTLNRLSKVITVYNNALVGSLNTPVPQQIIHLHLSVINSLSTYIQTLKMIQVSYIDPIIGIVGVNLLTDNRSKLTDSMAVLRLQLINTVN